MNTNNFKFECPKCGSGLSAWADLDAKVTFDVCENGNLTRRRIKNTHQSDGRAGVECKNCNWEATGDDLANYPNFEKLSDEALERQDRIELLSAKNGE